MQKNTSHRQKSRWQKNCIGQLLIERNDVYLSVTVHLSVISKLVAVCACVCVFLTLNAIEV